MSAAAAGSPPLLLALNEDCITEVLGYADRPSLHAAMSCHRALAAALQSNEYLWTELLARDWPGVEPDQHEEPRKAYRRQTNKFGRTAHCFARTAAVWKRLETFFAEHANELPISMLENLEPGCADVQEIDAAVSAAQAEWKTLQVTVRRAMREELIADGVLPRKPAGSRASAAAASADGDTEMRPAAPAASSSTTAMDFESAIGLPPREEKSNIDADTQEADGHQLRELHLPDDLMCSLLFHDGQEDVQTREDVFTGVLGGFSFYSFGCNFRLSPLVEILSGTTNLSALMLETRQHEAKLKRKANKRRKSIGSKPNTTAELKDVAGDSSSTSSSSSSPEEQEDIVDTMELLIPITTTPIGPEMVQFFVRAADGTIVRRRQDASLHVVAPSYLDWMERYVSDLENGMFACTRLEGINRFPTKDECGSDTTTNGIRIQANALYVPEQSNSHQHFFSYRVRLTHAGRELSNTRATLVSRHWVIEDANGKIDRVDGPGVIGFYPFVHAEMDLFTYESCCPIATETGKMRGHFRFKEEHTEVEFDAMIQPFLFDTRRNYV